MKKVITTFTLATIMMMGATFANANGGIIVAGFTGDKTADPCVETDKDFGGIIVAGLTGIIVAGFTGIIVAGAADEAPVNCGIIVSD